MSNRFATALLPFLLVVALTPACQTARQDTTPASQSPVIEASPVQQGENSWKIATADTVTLTVLAPSAKSVKIMYRPIVETDRHVVLKTINSPVNGQSGKFTTSIKLVKDFANQHRTIPGSSAAAGPIPHSLRLVDFPTRSISMRLSPTVPSI